MSPLATGCERGRVRNQRKRNATGNPCAEARLSTRTRRFRALLYHPRQPSRHRQRDAINARWFSIGAAYRTAAVAPPVCDPCPSVSACRRRLRRSDRVWLGINRPDRFAIGPSGSRSVHQRWSRFPGSCRPVPNGTDYHGCARSDRLSLLVTHGSGRESTDATVDEPALVCTATAVPISRSLTPSVLPKGEGSENEASHFVAFAVCAI